MSKNEDEEKRKINKQPDDIIKALVAPFEEFIDNGKDSENNKNHKEDKEKEKEPEEEEDKTKK